MMMGLHRSHADPRDNGLARLPLHQAEEDLFLNHDKVSVEISDNEDDENENKQKKVLTRRTLLLGFNIIAWYFTNSMNGVAMQNFAVKYKNQTPFWSLLTITCMVTTVQLLLGTALGVLLLELYTRYYQEKFYYAELFLNNPLPIILYTLHGIGSVCTNVGFMYGSASLVQIIKLLEPFETLAWTKLLLSNGSKDITIGVYSSMLLTVGSAFSLIKFGSQPPNPTAVAFAILSGLSLSCRNVLQSKHHAQTEPTSPVVASLQQFTRLSLWGGIGVAFATIPMFMILPQPLPNIPLAVAFYHPLYNAFSMLTLGFCSALTHSLWNAGKRVAAIVWAMMWFHERSSVATGLALLLVLSGGCWYSFERKQKLPAQAYKPALAVMLLLMLYSIGFTDKRLRQMGFSLGSSNTH